MQIVPIAVIAVILVLAVAAISVGLQPGRDRKNKEADEDADSEDRESAIKEANRRLTENPKDSRALTALGDIAFHDGDYKKAMRLYRLLLDTAGDSDPDGLGRILLRHGLSAMECEAWSDAFESLMAVRSGDPASFEVNAGLGKLEYMRKNYEKTVAFAGRALESQPDHAESLKYLGQSLYHLNKFSDAATHLKLALAANPEDKESLYALARCEYENSHTETAQKLFRQIRNDPTWGPRAALYSGSIYAKKREWEEAAADYQIGLLHKTLPQDVKLELKYRLAEALNQNQRLDRALVLLNELFEEAPDYKDVANQIQRYRELNSNKNLQVFLLAPANEFSALCRRITQVMFPTADSDTMNEIAGQSAEFKDILIAVKTPKWEDTVLLRFMRTEGQVGELFVRDLYAHSKEVRAGRGMCITAGSFTAEAIKFVEARLIELVDKPALLKILKSIDAGFLISRD